MAGDLAVVVSGNEFVLLCDMFFDVRLDRYRDVQMFSDFHLSVVAERRPSNGHAMRLADAAVTEAAPPLSALEMIHDSSLLCIPEM